MQSLRLLFTLTAIVAVVFNVGHADEEKECTHGVEVSCIQSFHEAMAPSCHKYMPAKDYGTVRQHVPNMLAEAERIAEFKLDSTYASVSDEFDEKREAFLLAVMGLKTAADGSDDAKLAEAFDKMHSAFAEMASVLALMPDEVEDFHAIIAEVWHDHLPNKDYDAIKKALPGLRMGCAKMKSAKLHEAKQGMSDQYQKAIEDIESAITQVEKVIDSKSEEQISEAVGALHDGFKGVIALF
jgi:hypothetical protein